MLKKFITWWQNRKLRADRISYFRGRSWAQSELANKTGDELNAAVKYIEDLTCGHNSKFDQGAEAVLFELERTKKPTT